MCCSRYASWFFDLKNLGTLILVLTACCSNYRRRLTSWKRECIAYMRLSRSTAAVLLLISFYVAEIDSTLGKVLFLIQQYVGLEKVNFLF